MRSPTAEFRVALLTLVATILAGCHGKTPEAPKLATADIEPKQESEPKISISSMDRRVPVIMYHDIVARPTAHPVYFDTSSAEFEAQMNTLEKRGFQPISVDQLYAHLTKGAEIPRKSVVLTFDDNYLGFYENAVPILKRHNYPAVEFVHTNFIGVQTGDHPKMTWDQLKELAAGGLVTIGAHTESHPADIRKLPEAEQQREIVGSKEVLEKGLGRKIEYFAYPDGANDEVSRGIVKAAGFKLAFSTHTGLAEESRSLQAVNRYEHLKLNRALDEAEKAMADGPAAVEEQDLTDSPVTLTVAEFEGLKIGLVKGGLPQTVLSDTREGVVDLARANNAVAGINGSFFSMAAIASTSNQMIGPCYVPNKKEFLPDTNPSLEPKLVNRPMVMWGPKKLAIFNFQPDSLNTEAPYRDYMPDFDNLFLAGAWIVHHGVPLTADQLDSYATHDHNDTRRRAFFGWSAKGEPMIGASLQTCSTARLAEAAAAAGVQEAVLLDSGFSTSLVYNGRIVVTGHTAHDIPSRPVPHAILLMGNLDLTDADAMLASAAEGARSPEDIEGERRAIERARARRLYAMRKKTEDALKAAAAAANPTSPLADPNQAPPGVAPPDAGPPTPPTTTATTGGDPPKTTGG